MNLKTDNKSLWYLRKYPFEYCFGTYIGCDFDLPSFSVSSDYKFAFDFVLLQYRIILRFCIYDFTPFCALHYDVFDFVYKSTFCFFE